METLKPLFDIISAISNTLTIFVSGIAIYAFVAKRNEIATAFNLLINFSYQTTLSELKEKLERLNEYNAAEPEHIPKIRNILHEISGQIRGNSRLNVSLPLLAGRFESLANIKRLQETAKRSLVSEARELLKNLNAGSIENYMEK